MTARPRLVSILTGGLLTAGLVACGTPEETTDVTAGTVAHVGELPDLQTGRSPNGRPIESESLLPPTSTASSEPDDTEPADTAPDDTEAADTAPDDTDDADADSSTTSPGDSIPGLDGVVGGAAAGNRILALGDSITAAVGPQYGGQLCDELEDQGWFLGVDALQGRAIEAGLSVLRSDVDVDDWDAAIVNLGSNYRGDADDYAADLRAILTELAPVPVLVVTVTEFEESIAEVNFVIRDISRGRDGVWVTEWSERTRSDESLTGADGLHLSEQGRVALAETLAEAIGDAPRAGDAEPGCELLRDAEQTSSDGDGTTDTDAGNRDSSDGGG